MPATPKSPRSNKKISGPSKNKGAVRAKSGCYTCRIRRKKCDENRTVENGPCGTCSRLKLECLGFGAKRPDWLRDSHKVTQIRDRIKGHLASQGMIKGHSGSGTRNAIHLPTLRLSTFEEDGGAYQSGSGSSSSGSPRPRELSVDSDQSFPVPQQLALVHNTSTMRGYPPIHGHIHAYPQEYDAHYLTQYPPHMDFHHHTSRFVSPSGSSMNQSYDEGMDFTPGFLSNSVQALESPAIRSRFSDLYHLNLWTFDESFNIQDDLSTRFYQLPSETITAQVIDVSVCSYVARIVKVQYLLGDGRILPNMIFSAISEHDLSHEAVKLLAHTYYNRQRKPTEMVLKNDDVSSRVLKLLQDLKRKGFSSLSADDAMTALHIVSLYLFDGGQGAWASFLTFASHYVRTLLGKSHFTHSDVLMACDEKDQFIVKTTIWFDVLASITTRREPRLLDVIRQLFDPRRCHIEPTYSMLDPMGCENVVVWAMAEASYLSFWKRQHMRQGDLSVVDLVTRTREIDRYLHPKPPQPQLCPPDPPARARYLASEIFRTSTRLFLESIVSGDFPHVPDIKRAVGETMACIQNLPAGEYESAIVRSTVFGFFVCGALTDDPAQQNILRLKLQQSKGDESVGNCPTILGVLEGLWQENAMRPKKEPVGWRRMLKEQQILLV